MDVQIRGETERDAVELAERIGAPVEDAIGRAVRETLARQRDLDESWAAVQAIQRRVADAIAASGERMLTQAEWDEENYDEWGAPR